MEGPRTKIASGRTAELFTYKPGQVLKLFREGIPAELSAEEYRVSLHIYQAGISTPQPVGVTEYNGRRGIIYENASGITMLRAISKKPWNTGKEAARMAKLHLQLHDQDITGLPRQKTLLEGQIRTAPKLTDVEKEQIISRLMNLKEGSKLCHGDFHPDNIILGEREWIIDWMTGMSGNPAGDAARTIIMLQMGTMPDGTPRMIKALIARVREQLTKKYIFHYITAGNIQYEEIESWMLPVAAARLTEGIPEKEKDKLLSFIRGNLK